MEFNSLNNYNINKIIFAIPSCPMEDRKEIFELCTKTGCVVKTMPSIYQMVENTEDGEFVKQIRDVGIEDLLGREPIKPPDCRVGNCRKRRKVTKYSRKSNRACGVRC